MGVEQTQALIDDLPNFKNVIRSKLMKQGGVGYVQPGPDTFPGVEQLHEMIVLLGALPCFTWLDGTSQGEQDIEELLGLMIDKGAVAVNIVPDRNWNIADPDVKAVKVRNLYEIVRLAQERDLPLNIGTEMNKLGLPFVDDLSCEALQPYRDSLLRGACIMVGHTVLARYADCSYVGERAATEFPEIGARNTFFEQVGRLPAGDNAWIADLESAGPDKAFGMIRDRVGA